MPNIFDQQLFKIASAQVTEAGRLFGELQKVSFVDPSAAQGGDPAAQGGGGGGGGLDPNAAAAAMAPDSAQMQGVMGQPGGGGALTEDRVLQLIQQSQQAGMAGGGMAGGMAGGAGAMGPGGKPKMKIDVNTEIYHVKRLLVGLYNALGLSVPADTLLGDPAEDPYATMQEAQQDPASAAAAPGALESSIKPIQPIRGAAPQAAGGGAQGAGAAGGGGGSEKTSSLLREDGHAVPQSFGPSPLVGQAHALAALIAQVNQE